MDTENRLIVVKGKGAGDWVRRVKELSKEKQKKKIHGSRPLYGECQKERGWGR